MIYAFFWVEKALLHTGNISCTTWSHNLRFLLTQKTPPAPGLNSNSDRHTDKQALGLLSYRGRWQRAVEGFFPTPVLSGLWSSRLHSRNNAIHTRSEVASKWPVETSLVSSGHHVPQTGQQPEMRRTFPQDMNECLMAREISGQCHVAAAEPAPTVTRNRTFISYYSTQL